MIAEALECAMSPRLKKGLLSCKDLLAGLFLAGIRNIKPGRWDSSSTR